jgi:hypothetical protein
MTQTETPSHKSHESCRDQMLFDTIEIASAWLFTDEARTLHEELLRICHAEAFVDRLIGVLPVRFEGARFTPNAQGEMAIIIPCRTRRGMLVDVAAAHPERQTIATMLGRAWCTQSPHPVIHTSHPNRLHVRRSVWGWLASGCRDALVVDWHKAAIATHTHDGLDLVAADLHEGRAIRDELQRNTRRPQIFILAEGARS